eukprot:COSAG01_NODE_9470_length_2437_cov_98.514970_3_plen_38_part_00
MHWEFYAPDAVRLGSAVTLSRRFVSSLAVCVRARQVG